MNNRSLPRSKKKSTNPRRIELQGLSPRGYHFPLETEHPVIIEDEVQHALFQRCCELYRMMDLLRRQTPALIEAYSRFHSRHQFVEALQCRHFSLDGELAARLDPELLIWTNSLFNMLHELKVSLSCTEALPHTLQAEIEGALYLLIEGWERVRPMVQEKYGWAFLRIDK
jgi:hypothetical protein